MRLMGPRMWQWPQFEGRRPDGPGSWAVDDREIGRIVMDELAEMPEVRSELVTPLRLAIEEKRYSVPEEQVAETMLYRCLADLLR
jgi:hypothetical protein